ncbi:MAG: cell division protein FtsZ [Armatimonadetes bacterium]|jgi:cell division protein FtsZ|nr:cell division protein FtsZ [Armatimonadota bacterium]
MATSTDELERASIRVVGVGGGGCNAVNRMIEAGVQGVDFIAMNTDAVALQLSRAPCRVQLGGHLTRGLGTGGDPERGRRAAEESKQEIARLLDGADMIFITAGMGGGTGTGGAAVIAGIAQELDALTVGVVTRPFRAEGPRRARAAEEGLARLRERVDALITIPNDRLCEIAERRLPLREAFRMADDILRQGVQGISDIIHVPGEWNVDFADVRSIMQQAGTALMGIGQASGDKRALAAAQAAISSPLLETSIEGAKGVLVNITAPGNFLMEEFDEITRLIRDTTDPNEANIITGLVVDETLGDEVKVTVVATGFGGAPPKPTATTQTAAPAPERPAAAAAPPLEPPAVSQSPRLSGWPPQPSNEARPPEAPPPAAAEPPKPASSTVDVLREALEATKAMGEGRYDEPAFLRRDRSKRRRPPEDREDQ